MKAGDDGFWEMFFALFFEISLQMLVRSHTQINGSDLDIDGYRSQKIDHRIIQKSYDYLVFGNGVALDIMNKTLQTTLQILQYYNLGTVLICEGIITDNFLN